MYSRCVHPSNKYIFLVTKLSHRAKDDSRQHSFSFESFCTKNLCYIGELKYRDNFTPPRMTWGKHNETMQYMPRERT